MTTTFEGIIYEQISGTSTAKVTGTSSPPVVVDIPQTVEIGGVQHTVIEIANEAFIYITRFLNRMI